MVQAIPEGLDGRIVPYLMIDGAAAAIDFYKAAFGATERYRLEMPGGGIGHADVVINTASSIAIDATANGTPVICVGFDAHGPMPGERTVRGLYDLTHLTNIVRSGGVEMAGSIDQLLDQVDGFLANPDLLEEGRARLIREQCYQIDGQSANRVADAILEVVGASQN